MVERSFYRKAVFLVTGLMVLAGAAPGFSAEARPGSGDSGRPWLILSGSERMSYRFLWPADSSRPGENLIELSARPLEKDVRTDTPVGKALASSFDLVLPSGEVVARTRIMKLQDHEGAFVFETELKKEVPAATGKYELPHFALPALAAPRAYSNVLTFKVQEFAAPVHRPVASSGPVLLFTNGLSVAVFSPLDNFMDALTAPANGEWRCGFGGKIERVPAGTVHRVLLVSGHGVNRTFVKWGKIIQAWHGHRPADPYADVAMSRLGYWTDNGSYYYYRTEPGLNYAQTLVAIKKSADAAGIPYGYFQLDSWWYPKGVIPKRSSHYRGGVMLWEPIPEMFPRGLPEFTRELGLPLVAHNRYVADESPYCLRYKCVYGNDPTMKGALPIDPKFWDEIMDNATKFGVQVYEQDWLYTHLAIIPWLRSGLGNAAAWYDAMASAAEQRGITMQLCMASPEFFLQQLKHGNATHARVSHDYKGGLAKSFFWVPFHEASLFAYAVGLWPFKDNFQSSQGQRPTYNIIPEGSPFEEVLVAALSGGPVGPSDRMGFSDCSLIMRTCRKDGLLLKPDRPATPIDLMFLHNDNLLLGGNRPWIISTESETAAGRVIYLAAFNLWPGRMIEPSVPLSALEPDPGKKYVAYDWRSRKVFELDHTLRFGWMPPNDGFYYVITPILGNGMAVIGEPDKFITLSAKRFPQLELSGKTLTLEVEGVPGEEITLLFFAPAEPAPVQGSVPITSHYDPASRLLSVRAVLPASGRLALSVESK